jgi:hypothetical protein
MEGLVGRELPSGTFTLTRERYEQFAESVEGDPSADPTIDALWILSASEATELLALADCDIERDGPMLGGISMEVQRALELDREYATRKQILGLERKHGRRAGTFDLLKVRAAIADDDGDVAAVVTTYVLPRR